jgi:glycosyltransferase involved in cell wall biosynthesis
MKLLIYLNSLTGGGAERVTANLANHWAAKGWTVTIVTITPVPEDFYALHPGVRRISLELPARSSRLIEAATRNLRRIRALRQILLESQPDVALAMMTNASVVLSLACRNLPRICAVGSERTYPGQVSLHPIWSLLRRMQYGRLHAIVGQTSECVEWILRHTSSSNAVLIPNSVELPLPVKSPVIDPETKCRPGRKILLAVGRLVEEKDFHLLINVFARLAPGNPEWDLVILGTGPLEASLRQHAHACGVADRVFLPGLAGNPGAWYARSDVYVMTSRFEGFPNTLVEALAHGVPGVSFDCDTGPRDIIRHNVDGLLVPPGDAQGLQQSLQRLMADTVRRRLMAERAVEARERFSIDRIAESWEGLFK